jgi:DNA ligase (NAD+)
MLSLENAFTTRTSRISMFGAQVPRASRRGGRSPSPRSRRSTACRCRCATRTGGWCRRPRAATARRARTSPRTPAPSATFREPLTGAPDVIEVRGEVYMSRDDFAALNARQAEAGARPSPIRATPPPARCASSTRDHRRAAAALLRLCLGRAFRARGRDAAGALARGFARLGASGQSADEALCDGPDEMLAHYRAIEAQRATLPYDIDGVVYKVTTSPCSAARLPLDHAPLGHRAQVPGRTGLDPARGDRHPGRPHRRAVAGGAARR